MFSFSRIIYILITKLIYKQNGLYKDKKFNNIALGGYPWNYNLLDKGLIHILHRNIPAITKASSLGRLFFGWAVVNTSSTDLRLVTPVASFLGQTTLNLRLDTSTSGSQRLTYRTTANTSTSTSTITPCWPIRVACKHRTQAVNTSNLVMKPPDQLTLWYINWH